MDCEGKDLIFFPRIYQSGKFLTNWRLCFMELHTYEQIIKQGLFGKVNYYILTYVSLIFKMFPHVIKILLYISIITSD